MNSKPTVKLSVVIVNYNGRRFLKGCLDSIAAAVSRINAEVILVDNNSDDDSACFVEHNYSWVRLVRHNENIGYAAANNIGARLSSGEFIFFLNPDTIVLEQALETMLQTIEQDSKVGILSCRLLNGDGTLQYSIGQFPSWTNQLCQTVFLHRILPSFKGGGELLLDKAIYGSPREIDWAFGAALMVGRRTFMEVGGFDENYFFGSDEKDLCYRVKSSGWKVCYTPSAEIIHYGRGWRDDIRITRELVLGRIYFTKKHYSRAESAALRLILMMQLLLRSGLWLFPSLFLKSSRRRFKEYSIALTSCIRGA